MNRGEEEGGNLRPESGEKLGRCEDLEKMVRRATDAPSAEIF